MDGELRDRRYRTEEQDKASKEKRPQREIPLRVLTSQLIGRVIRSWNSNNENPISGAP